MNNNPCYATFTGKGGYPLENQRANATFTIGNQYIITGGAIGRTNTTITLKDFPGSWNSVLFDFNLSHAPLSHSYYYIN